jgi:hypothetical protein
MRIKEKMLGNYYDLDKMKDKMRAAGKKGSHSID